MLTIPGPGDKQGELCSAWSKKGFDETYGRTTQLCGLSGAGETPSAQPSRFPVGPTELLSQRGKVEKDSEISGTYPLYCHWRWIFPPPGLALDGGGLSGSLQDETTPSSQTGH